LNVEIKQKAEKAPARAGTFIVRPSLISAKQLPATKKQAGTFFSESAQLGCCWLPLVDHIRTFFADPPPDIIEYLRTIDRYHKA